jgi:hypothetical protein
MSTKFKPGDHVERIGLFVPSYKRHGTVIRAMPDNDGIDLLNEYEVYFGNRVTAVVSEPQLRLVGDAPRSS